MRTYDNEEGEIVWEIASVTTISKLWFRPKGKKPFHFFLNVNKKLSGQ